MRIMHKPLILFLFLMRFDSKVFLYKKNLAARYLKGYRYISSKFDAVGWLFCKKNVLHRWVSACLFQSLPRGPSKTIPSFSLVLANQSDTG
jgi:hypothetical protein